MGAPSRGPTQLWPGHWLALEGHTEGAGETAADVLLPSGPAPAWLDSVP